MRGLAGGTGSGWADPAQLALYFNALSRLATALVVLFGIKEISAHRRGGPRARPSRACCASSVDGWKYIGQTPLVRGLVLGIFGAFAGGGIVIGTGQVLTAKSLGAGDAGLLPAVRLALRRVWRSASALGR